MKHIKRFNEEFEFRNIFKKRYKNQAIVDAVESAGLSIRKVDDEVYRTNPKNGYEFHIASGSDAFSVETSYYGTQYKSELVRDNLSEYISDIINGAKPDITHKYNYMFRNG